MKLYCVYDAKESEQLLLVAETLDEVAKFVGARKLYVKQAIIRGGTISKKRYIVKRLFI